MAIRYADDLEFEENILSHWTVRSADPTDTSVQIVRFYQDGEPIEMPRQQYARQAYVHSTAFLLGATEGWEYVVVPSTTTIPNTNRRKVRTGTIVHSVQVRHKTFKMIDFIRLEKANGLLFDERIYEKYDEQQRIVGRQWKDKANRNFRVARTYNEAGEID